MSAPGASRAHIRDMVFLSLMVALAVLLPLLFAPEAVVGPDNAAYLRIAGDQLSRPDFWSWPDAFDGNFWAMAYPTLLAFLLRATGGNLEAVAFIQVIVSASLVFVPWILTRAIRGLTRYAATFLVAVNPALWWMGNTIGYEFLLAASLCWSLTLAWGINQRSGSSKAHVIATSLCSGLLFGLAILTQTKALVVAPVLVYLLWRRSPSALWWGIAGLCAGLLPWAVRNVLVLGTPSPFTKNAGYNLWVGNNPEAITGGSMLVAPPTPDGQSQFSAALQFIISQPERFFDLAWMKSVRLLQPVYIYPDILDVGPARSLMHVVAALFSVFLATGVLFYLGARLAGARLEIPPLSPLAVAVALFWISHLPFIAETRYMAPVLSISTVIATVFWTSVVERKLTRHLNEETSEVGTGHASR